MYKHITLYFLCIFFAYENNFKKDGDILNTTHYVVFLVHITLQIKRTFLNRGCFYGFLHTPWTLGFNGPPSPHPSIILLNQICCIVVHGGFTAPGLEASRGLATGSPN
jgi:hypothetical protein